MFLKRSQLFIPPSVKIPGKYWQQAALLKKSRVSRFRLNCQVDEKTESWCFQKRTREVAFLSLLIPQKQTLRHLEVGCILVEDQGPAHRVMSVQAHLNI
jgi:hypothetical protein